MSCNSPHIRKNEYVSAKFSDADRFAVGGCVIPFSLTGHLQKRIPLTEISLLNNGCRPGRHMWGKPIMDPLPLTPVMQDAPFFQQGKMTGRFRLGFLQDSRELTDAKFTFFTQQEDQSQTGFISKSLEKHKGGKRWHINSCSDRRQCDGKEKV